MIEFEVKKSAWSVVNFWWIIACILVIPAIILVFRIIAAKKERIIFYADKIVVKKGWLNISEKSFAFTGVFSVDISQTLIGRIFNYGTLEVDFVGRNDINTNFVTDPRKLKEYLESKIVKKQNVHTYMN